MAKFCTQCGASLNEGSRFCNKCGAKLAPTQSPQQSPPPTIDYQAPQSEANYGQDPYQRPYQAPFPQSGTPAANADLKPNLAGLLCYPLLFITGILFLVLTPYNKNSFVRFHAYQSIFFFVALIVLQIIVAIFSLLNPVGAIDALMSTGLSLLAFGGIIWLMYQAYLGNKFKLPVIGDLAEEQAAKE